MGSPQQRLRTALVPPQVMTTDVLEVHRDSISRRVEPEREPRPPTKVRRRSRLDGPVNSAAHPRGSHRQRSTAHPYQCRFLRERFTRKPPASLARSPPNADLEKRAPVKTRTQIAKAANRRRQRQGHQGRAEWRKAPATSTQVEALRVIAMSTGHTFSVSITRGDAWRRIKTATTLLDADVRTRCSPPWHTSSSSSHACNVRSQ